MLLYFQVENYRNLQIREKLRFQTGTTLIYGNCGAGKSNLCDAIQDFLCSPYRINVIDKIVSFTYCFMIEGQEMWLNYKRDGEGVVQDLCVAVPALFSVINFKNFKEKIELDLENVKNYEFNQEAIKEKVIKTAWCMVKMEVVKRT